MALTVAEYRRIFLLEGRDAARRTHEASNEPPSQPRAAAAEPRSRQNVAAADTTGGMRLTPLQARFVRLAGLVQHRLHGRPPSQAHLEVIREKLHFEGTGFFGVMRQLERVGAVKRVDDDTVRYEIVARFTENEAAPMPGEDEIVAKAVGAASS